MKNILKKCLPVILLAVLLLCAVPATPVMGWGAVVDASEVHQLILRTAYNFLSSDPAFNPEIFPTLEEILANEGVTEWVSGNGPGPDAENANSPWADHWYNADAPGSKGNAPNAVKREFQDLLQFMLDIKIGSGITQSSSPQHAAAWGAHFLADVETPFHTNGVSREEILRIYNAQGGHGASSIILDADIVGSLDFCYRCVFDPDWDFKPEIEAFLARTDPMADWFDPWYNNGATDISSSHVLWEGFAGNIKTIPAVTTYSPGWKNWENKTPVYDLATIAANQAGQAAAFAELAAENSRRTQLAGLNNPEACVAVAAQRVASLWRAGFTAVSPWLEVTVPDATKPNEFKITGHFTNTGSGQASQVKAKLTVTGGTISGGDTKSAPDASAGNTSEISWNVKANSADGCSLRLDVVYDYSQPDMQYASVQDRTGQVQPAATTPADNGLHSTVILINGSSQIKGISFMGFVNLIANAVESLPDEGVEVALYGYGKGPYYGEENWYGPVSPFLSPAALSQALSGIPDSDAEALGGAPLAAAITGAGQYLQTGAKGTTGSIILLSPTSVDTTGGDPEAAVKSLTAGIEYDNWNPFIEKAFAAGIPVSFQVVGVNVASAADEQGLRDLAAAGNGSYFNVSNMNQLGATLAKAIEQGMQDAGASDKFQFEWWWFAAGGAVLLLVIALITGTRRKQPVTVNAGAYTPPARPSYTAAPPPVMSPPTAAPVIEGLFCPKCGAQAQQNANFCTRCGATLEATATAAPAVPSNIYCTHCGNTIPADSAFCNRCGTATTPGTSRTQPPPAAPATAGKSYAAWWLLGIFLGIIGGVIAWSSLKNENPTVARRILMFGLFITLVVFMVVTQNMI
ncbi:MAG: zinc ribbon domain-containing protein [Dehalococcoidales bacterium]|jgi:hypothetical protein